MLGPLGPLPLRLTADQLSGLSAEQHARLCADLVASVRTAALAVMRFESVVTGAQPTFYVGQHGLGTDQYPTLTRMSAGVYRIIWPSAGFAEPWGVFGAFAPRYGCATPTQVGPSGGSTNVTPLSLSTPAVEVRVINNAGTPADTLFSLAVW